MILLAARAGDVEAWHHVRSNRGRLRKPTAGQALATFDAPGQAIRCATAIRDEAAGHGIKLRAGIHNGEADLVDEGVDGISVESAEAVAAPAGAGEILVSRTVKDLVVGSGISSSDRGSHSLTAADDHWPLSAVAAA